jgi:hypothetical protein
MAASLFLNMPKMSRAILFLFLFSAQLYAQADSTRWPISFPSASVRDIDSIRSIIEGIVTGFNTGAEKGTIKVTSVDDPDNEGYITWIYRYHNKLIGFEHVYNWANNGSRTCIFDSLGNIRCVSDFGHGISWFNSYYAYVTPKSSWVFNYSEWEIVIGEDHFGHYASAIVPLRKKLWLANRSDMEFNAAEEKGTALHYLKIKKH